MRDYVELVKSLRLCAKGHCESGCMCFRADLPFAGCTIDQDEDDLKLFAADAIEELLDELTTIRKQLPHWISVEERLPETAYRVLTCSGEYVTENMMCTTIDVEGKHLVWAFRDGLVTHWMPLPEPPKGVE